ncbi:RPA-related protein RADX isoform X1 [Xyrichtys novacula]|uniref:RPA-related protein RADX isoform X1 n=1 Tax=Xyrichtys novacula TaxID=13765 RepID=A0AAV1FSQ4_XYRNO|nr:RPA-related protein RADX isoform X1 [Xyrichtys novacula]
MEDNLSSSEVSDVSKLSFLQRTLERGSSSKCLKLRGGEVCVAVISVQRYLSEQSDGQQGDSYSYDVTITDGVWRTKCFLHTSLNHLVQTNTLRTGRDISITQCSFVYNERSLGPGYICIEELTCGADRSVVLSSVKDVSALPMLVQHGMKRGVELLSDVPLKASRKHYLSLWNNDDPEGDTWIPGSPSTNTPLDVSKLTPLSSLESSLHQGWKPLPLLVRIIHKSKLRYYGRFGPKVDYPFQAYFEVADQSGITSLVLWNDLCLEFYQRLTVGTVLYLQNYFLRKSYSKRSRPYMDHYRMKIFTSVEISLDPRSAVITVVSPKGVLPQWRLPEVSYQFTTRSELETLSNNSACDVICLVTFVGRVERVKSKYPAGPEKFWTYRWIHGFDGTSEQPFILEVFSSSQPDVYSQLGPMAYLVCTQMRVCHVEGSLLYLTSSNETESFITGYHKGRPYVSDPKVKSFITWTKTLKDDVFLQKSTVGGHYCYPHPPLNYTQSMTDTPSPAQATLVSVADLKKELETLHYREHKRLAIQGQITAVRYIKHPKTTESTGTDRTEVSNVPADVCESDTHSHPSTAEQTSMAEKTSASKRKRGQKRAYEKITEGGEQDQEEESYSDPEEVQEFESHSHLQNEERDSDALSWESSGWSQQKEELWEHLCHGGLNQVSLCQRFTIDDKDILLQQSNLQPARWTPENNTGPTSPLTDSGYYQVTILGMNKEIAVDAVFSPIVSAEEPRAVGLPQDPHGNTMLSCLSSGFLCPLNDPANHSEVMHPEPAEVLMTASELEDTHVVCVLDLCHLGGDQIEVFVSKVYKVS